MSPILTGVIASGISGHLTPPWSPEGAYDALATITLSASTASVTFAGIPSGYKHLQIRAIAKNSAASAGYDYVHATFNGDTGSNYSLHYLYGNGASAIGAGNSGLTYSRVGNLAQLNTTNVFGASIIDILDYSSSAKHKTVRSLAGHEANGNNSDGVVHLYSSAWSNTNPITSITFFPPSGSFVANSTFALYGVK